MILHPECKPTAGRLVLAHTMGVHYRRPNLLLIMSKFTQIRSQTGVEVCSIRSFLEYSYGAVRASEWFNRAVRGGMAGNEWADERSNNGFSVLVR